MLLISEQMSKVFVSAILCFLKKCFLIRFTSCFVIETRSFKQHHNEFYSQIPPVEICRYIVQVLSEDYLLEVLFQVLSKEIFLTVKKQA